MAATCYHCEKQSMYGRSHTHHRGVAGGRWKKRAQKTARIFKANLQPVWVLEKGEKKRVRLCTKCIKRMKKDIVDGKPSFLKFVFPTSRLKSVIDERKKTSKETKKAPKAKKAAKEAKKKK